MSEPTDFTNFDLNAVPAELREHVERAYKQLQGDYTRKRQEDSQARREAELSVSELQQQQKDLQTALIDYRNANEAWVNWSQTVAKTEALQDGDEGDEGLILDTPGQGRTRVTKRSEFEQAQQRRDAEIAQLKDQLSRVSTALDMSLQIDELRHEYPGIDPKKVIDTALQLKIPDLHKARDIAYREDDVNAEVNKRVETELKTRLEQERTKVLDRGSDVPFELFKKMPEGPPSFDTASESILREKVQSQFGSL